jgi:hypothetical protein
VTRSPRARPCISAVKSARAHSQGGGVARLINLLDRSELEGGLARRHDGGCNGKQEGKVTVKSVTDCGMQFETPERIANDVSNLDGHSELGHLARRATH